MIKLLGVYILIKRYRNTYRFTQSGCIFRLNKSVHKVQSAKAVIVLDLSNKIVHTAIEAIAFLFSLYGWVSIRIYLNAVGNRIIPFIFLSYQSQKIRASLNKPFVIAETTVAFVF